MSNIAEIEKLALELSVTDRALLATRLLDSLPPVLEDDDDGTAEALRRAAELDADPSLAISIEELDEFIARRRG